MVNHLIGCYRSRLVHILAHIHILIRTVLELIQLPALVHILISHLYIFGAAFIIGAAKITDMATLPAFLSILELFFYLLIYIHYKNSANEEKAVNAFVQDRQANSKYTTNF
jgi:hypothetical protein